MTASIIKAPNIKTYPVAIIGAGIAGSYCAWQLQKKDIETIIIEKSRGTGGRASSKRLEDSSADMGAPFLQLSAQNQPLLQTDIDYFIEQQVLSPWLSDDDSIIEHTYVGTPRMSQLTRFLSQHSDMKTSARACHLIKVEQDKKPLWLIADGNYQPITLAERVIITAPANQAADLLANSSCSAEILLAAHQASQNCRPIWSQLIAITKLTNKLLILKPLIYFNSEQSSIIDRVIHNSDKPDRASSEDYWVIQAKSEWSQQNAFLAASEVEQILLKEFIRLVQIAEQDFAVQPIQLHRWLLATFKSGSFQQLNGPENTSYNLNNQAIADTNYLWSNTDNIAIAADWLCQGDIAGAMISAKQLIEQQF